MKMIEAIIEPFSLDEVRDALTKAGVREMTVSEVRGYGRHKGHRGFYRAAEYTVDFLPKVEIQVLVPDETAKKVVETIMHSARVEKTGDDKIFVMPVEEVVYISPGGNGCGLKEGMEKR